MENASKRKILIFGATGSVGSALCEHLKNDFCVQTVSSRKNANADFCADLANLDMTGFDLEQIDTYSALIFAQGINPHKGFHEITGDDFMRMFNINVAGPALILQKIHRSLEKNAAVIFFGSVASRKGSYDPSYAASKGALEGLMHALANALPHLRFNLISLGLVQDSTVHRSMTPDFVERHRARMQDGRLVRGKDIASLAKELILNTSFNRAAVNLDCGFQA